MVFIIRKHISSQIFRLFRGGFQIFYVCTYCCSRHLCDLARSCNPASVAHNAHNDFVIVYVNSVRYVGGFNTAE